MESPPLSTAFLFLPSPHYFLFLVLTTGFQKGVICIYFGKWGRDTSSREVLLLAAPRDDNEVFPSGGISVLAFEAAVGLWEGFFGQQSFVHRLFHDRSSS